MDRRDIDYINDSLRNQAWLKPIEEIAQIGDSRLFRGTFDVATTKGTLSFTVIVSADFPLDKIGFFCNSVKGYNHQMRSGLLCLNAAPAKTIQDRLRLELEKLQLWIEKYYINGEVDSHFEYYQMPFPRDVRVIFEEDSDSGEPEGTMGKFSYAEFNSYTVDEKTVSSWIALDLGGRTCRWATSTSSRYSKKYQGFWIMVDRPPVTTGRQVMEYWKDLLPLLTPDQTKYLYDNHRSIKQSSPFEYSFLLMLGYRIPSEFGQELHWDSILIRFDSFPFEAVKVAPGSYGPEDLGEKIAWCKSSNASYKRMFGRGKLPDELTERNIQIIGVGALGSSLFLALVRGGCKKITISEYDDIEPGNACRGNFSFVHSGMGKISVLSTEAVSISPYLQLNVNTGIKPITEDNIEYPIVKDSLQHFDYIFDCSTDKYLSIMLDSMQLRGQIVNFSISNEANHLVAITGLGNIHKIKSDLYNRLSPESSEPFFVATGCWHPTFKASFTDISVLLMYAINEICLKLGKGQQLNSFYIRKLATDSLSIKYEISYEV